MQPFTLLRVFLLCILALPSYAQVTKPDMSPPLDIGATGVNKVLCMRNGSTVLFHFETSKPIQVTVFDSMHKKRHVQKHACRLLDLNMMWSSIFKGLYEINGEAVLFLEQEHLGKHALVRLRFDGNDGQLIEEELLGEWKSINKHTSFYVMKSREADSYAILFATEVPQFLECDLRVVYFSNTHKRVREVPLAVNRKKYDYMDVINAEQQPNGILITLVLSKMITNGRPANADIYDPELPVMDHTMALYYLPADSTSVLKNTIDIPRDVYPLYANYTYNPFASALNVTMLSYREGFKRNGLEVLPTAFTDNIFLHVDEQNMGIRYKWLHDKMATDFIKQSNTIGKKYEGLPVKTFTNSNGLTTNVSVAVSRYYYNLYGPSYITARDISRAIDSRFRYTGEVSNSRSDVFETYLGNIGITQLDDDGNELWGAVLPCVQYFMSHNHFYYTAELAKKWQHQKLFDDMPAQVYNRQFLSFNAYNTGKDLYVIYNDYNKNFKNSIQSPGDTIFSFDHALAFYYKVDRKKEVTKHYLYGTPGKNEFKCSFIEGADFDEQRKVYASLVQYTRNDNITLRMAWAQLD